MSKIYNCEECDKNYTTYMGLWYHNKKYHIAPMLEEKKKTSCKYCAKQLSCKQSKWRHEQKCQQTKNIPIDEKFKQLEDKIKVLEAKPSNTNNSNTTNNMTNSNNTINNSIQYVINAPTASSLDHLTFEVQKEVLDKGLNSLVCLIELINFNKSVPKNHSYCITAINDKHASVIDEKTNKVVKTNKFDLFDKVLGANLSNLEKLADNSNFTPSQKTQYKDKVNYLKTMMFQNNKFIKRYQSDINLMGYNNKDMIQETWKSLKELSDEDDEEEPYMGDRPRGFDDLIDEIPEDEKPDFLKKPNNCTKSINELNKLYGSDSESSGQSEDEEESEDEEDESGEYVEIKVKGQMYILEGNLMYTKTKKGTKGELYGTYSNGKVKKLAGKKTKSAKSEIDV
jgi:hypothetical protein